MQIEEEAILTPGAETGTGCFYIQCLSDLVQKAVPDGQLALVPSE